MMRANQAQIETNEQHNFSRRMMVKGQLFTQYSEPLVKLWLSVSVAGAIDRNRKPSPPVLLVVFGKFSS